MSSARSPLTSTIGDIRQTVAAVLLPVTLGGLELSHPTWGGRSAAEAVAAAGGWWLPLHGLLIIGYALLVLVLWRMLPGGAVPVAKAARLALMVFAACATAFLAVDGIAVGTLAQFNPPVADALWNGWPVLMLADVSGASWAAAQLCLARARSQRQTSGRIVTAGLVLTWLAFVASATPLAVPGVLSRIAAVATGGWAVYLSGLAGVPFALLVFAAVLHQHVGAEAALGMLCLAGGLSLERHLRE